MEVNRPTAYIVPPHCTIWRTCSTEPSVPEVPNWGWPPGSTDTLAPAVPGTSSSAPAVSGGDQARQQTTQHVRLPSVGDRRGGRRRPGRDPNPVAARRERVASRIERAPPGHGPSAMSPRRRSDPDRRRAVALAATEPARTLVSAGALAAALPLLRSAPRGRARTPCSCSPACSPPTCPPGCCGRGCRGSAIPSWDGPSAATADPRRRWSTNCRGCSTGWPASTAPRSASWAGASAASTPGGWRCGPRARSGR